MSAGQQHLSEAGLSYGAHLRRAWRIGGSLLVAGAACLIHGIFPGVFRTKASSTVVTLHEEITAGPQHRGQPMLLEFEI